MKRKIMGVIIIIEFLALNMLFAQYQLLPLWKSPELDDWIGSISISSDGNYVVAGSNKAVYLFDRSGNRLWKHTVGDEIYSVDMSSDSNFIAAAVLDGSVYCFNKSGKLLWKQNEWFNEEDMYLREVRISDDGQFIVVGTFSGVYFLDSADGFIRWHHRLEYNVWAVDLSRDGEIVAAISEGEAILVDKQSNLIWKKKMIAAHDIAVSSSGNYFAIPSSSRPGVLYFFDNTGNLLWKYEQSTEDTFNSVAISENEEYVAAGAVPYLYLFKTDGTLIFKADLKGEVGDVSISADGEYIVARSYGKTYVFNKKGDLLWEHPFGRYANDTFDYIDISSDGRYVVAISSDRATYKDYLSFFDNQLIIKEIEKEKLKNQAEEYFSEGNNHYNSAEYDTAISLYEKAKTLYEELDMSKKVQLCEEKIEDCNQKIQEKTETTSPPTITSSPATTSPPTIISVPTQPTSSPQHSNSLLYLGIFAAIIISILAVYIISKKKPEKEVIEEPIKKKLEEKPKPPKTPKEEISPELQRLLKEKENWIKKLEKLKNQKEKLISEGVITEEIYKQRYEEIMDQLVDIEDRIIQERMKGGKKK